MRPGGCPGAGGPPRSGGCSCLGRLGLVIDPQACCINKRDATYPGKHFLSWEVRRKEEGARTLSSMPDLGRGLHGVGVTGTGLHGCQGSHGVSLGMGLRGCQGPHGVSLGTGLRGCQGPHGVSLGMGSWLSGSTRGLSGDGAPWLSAFMWGLGALLVMAS